MGRLMKSDIYNPIICKSNTKAILENHDETEVVDKIQKTAPKEALKLSNLPLKIVKKDKGLITPADYLEGLQAFLDRKQ